MFYLVTVNKYYKALVLLSYQVRAANWSDGQTDHALGSLVHMFQN